MKTIRKPLLCFLTSATMASALITGCASTTSAGRVEADRSQLMLTDSASVNAQAAEIYKKELAEAKAKGVLNTDSKTLNRIRTIVGRLAPETGAFRSDAPAWDWEANLIKSPDVNAYCYPGGKIIVLTGIVDKLNLTDDELAAILGHEIAHALREHSREQMSQATLANVGVGIIGIFAGDGAANIAGAGAQVGMLKGSRTAETEADRIGVELMARAGYNPNGAVSLWKKMMAQSGGGSSNSIASFLSTHPADADRIRTVTADAQTVWPLYEEAKARQSAGKTSTGSSSAKQPAASSTKKKK